MNDLTDLTDLDYKDLFRDAIHMMAHIARAAGFDPADPTVEPPAIVARVERLRAERDALQARLDALAAPVEGCDVSVEEVLRLDREATPGPWHARAAHTENGYRTSAISLDRAEDDGFSPEGLALFGRTITVGVSGHDAHLIATYRTAAPALAREVVALRAALADAEGDQIAMCVACGPCDHSDEDGCCLTCGRDMIIVADAHSADMVREHWREAEEVEQERDELRLTLAAEQGRPEGAPPGWAWDGNWYGGHAIKGPWRYVATPDRIGDPYRWSVEVRCACPMPHKEENWHRIAEGEARTARAAMLAADKATP